MKKIFLFVTLLLHVFLSQAQVEMPFHIANSLKGNRSFRDYARMMTRYYDSLKLATTDSQQLKAVNSKYKKLARQLQYLEGRLDGRGNIVNVSQKIVQAKDELDAYMHQNNFVESHLGSWTIVGPQHVLSSYGNKGIGRVDRIAFHPTDPDIIYAGTPAGGLWKTTTGGVVWNSINDYLPHLGVSGIVVSHANPTTLYVLTGDGDSNLGQLGFVEGFDYIRPSIGILKSTDGGISWRPSSLNIPGFYVGYKLIQSPTDANVLLAATSKGLYRTDNGGSNWDLVSADSSRYYDIEWRPGVSAHLYAATANNIFMSTSAGQTWANITNRIPENISGCHRIALAVTPANNTVLYVMTGRNADGDSREFRIFRSTNTAGTFFLRWNGTYSWGTIEYMFNLAVSSVDFNKVVFANLAIGYSTDGASTFPDFSNYDDDTQPDYVHADIHELNYNPLNDKLFIGSDGGVFTTTDHGANALGRFLGMEATQFYHFNMDDNNSEIILGGAQDNGIMLKNDNTTFFKNYKAGDGFDIAFPHNGHGSFIVATINTNTYAFYPSFPDNWWVINQQNLVWYKTVATSWFDSTKYIGGTSIIKWVIINSSPSLHDANGRWALTTSPSNGNRLYAAGGPEWNDYGNANERSLSKSDDKAVTWTELINNPGLPDSIGKITSIALHPANSNFVVITLGGFQAGQKVYYSGNAGASWTNYTAGLPNLPVNVAVITSAGDIYIGNDIGVFYLSSGMNTWMPFFNDLPKVPVTDLKIQGSEIYASTFGRGIWKSGLASGSCASLITLSTNQSGRIFYEGNIINASSQLINGVGTEIYAKAQTETTLLPDFIANANTGEEFRSWIANCGQGGTFFPMGSPASIVQTAMKFTNDSLTFRLVFPALVSVIVADESDGSIRNNIIEELRLQEGLHTIKLPQQLQYKKIMLIADGEIIGTKEN
ncbi:MAG TPA: hypothetical protein VN451_06850 [Chitinophagaceae bacterium]|nr:hypothetical protein [Chitinophagaceae bacterium]